MATRDRCATSRSPSSCTTRSTSRAESGTTVCQTRGWRRSATGFPPRAPGRGPAGTSSSRCGTRSGPPCRPPSSGRRRTSPRSTRSTAPARARRARRRWSGARAATSSPARSTTARAALAIVVAAFARDAIDLLTGPTAGDLRACGAPGCILLFVKDHPRREWCSNACGNRARQARHYERVRRRG